MDLRKTGRGLSDDEWAALVGRTGASGVDGVVTTGIVCSPGCPARTPLRQNARWFVGVAEAEALGFRRCKRCGAA